MGNFKYDAIVIGSGPNGLAAAIELAKNGQEVLLVEAMNRVGGGTLTEELTLPGFHHDFCSAIHPLGYLSPYFKTLPLKSYGLEWIFPEASVAHPLEDEPAVLLKKSIDDTAANLGIDGPTWQRLFSYFAKHGEDLIKDMLKPLGIPSTPIPFTRFGLNAFLASTDLG